MQLIGTIRLFIRNANLNYFQTESEVLYENTYTYAGRIGEIKKGATGHIGHNKENNKYGHFMNLESKQSRKKRGTKNCSRTKFNEGRDKETTTQEDILKITHYSNTCIIRKRELVYTRDFEKKIVEMGR